MNKQEFESIPNHLPIDWEAEKQKCIESPYYFFTNYCTVNGEKCTTFLSEEEFNNQAIVNKAVSYAFSPQGKGEMLHRKMEHIIENTINYLRDKQRGFEQGREKKSGVDEWTEMFTTNKYPHHLYLPIKEAVINYNAEYKIKGISQPIEST